MLSLLCFLLPFAGLLAGVPQVLCPLHFDQPQNAERVAYLGLAGPSLARTVLFGSSTEAAGSQSSNTHMQGQPQAAEAGAGGGAGGAGTGQGVLGVGAGAEQEVEAGVKALAAAITAALSPHRLAACRAFAKVRDVFAHALAISGGEWQLLGTSTSCLVLP